MYAWSCHLNTSITSVVKIPIIYTGNINRQVYTCVVHTEDDVTQVKSAGSKIYCSKIVKEIFQRLPSSTASTS